MLFTQASKLPREKLWQTLSGRQITPGSHVKKLWKTLSGREGIKRKENKKNETQIYQNTHRQISPGINHPRIGGKV